MESFSVFGHRMASAYRDIVSIKPTPTFIDWYKINYQIDLEDKTAIPIEHWVNALQEGRAPRIYPSMTDYKLLHWVPMNILSVYFV